MSVSTRRGQATAWLLLLILAGCARAPSPFRVAVHNDPISLDPHAQNDVLTYGVLANVYEALTAFDAELKVRPGLGRSWENPEENTWLFHLRPGARFHDGRAVEAGDVVFTLERARSHPRSMMASYLVEVESVSARGPSTVMLTTRRPTAVLLNKLAFVFVVPRGAPETIAAPVGSGPYRFVSYSKGEALELAPATPGRGGAGSPLTFLPVQDPRQRVERLRRGELDIVQDVPPTEAAALRNAPGCRILSRSSLVMEYLHMRTDDLRFADRRVRQAIHLALDRRRLVETMLHGFGEPAGQIVGPGVFGYDPELKPPERDLARARRLLADAGFPSGFAVTLEYRTGRQGAEIARQLGELGLAVDLASAPWPEIYPRLQRSEVAFYYGGVVAPTADASDIFDSFVHSRQGAYGRTNFNRYANPRLDALIERSGTILDLRERREMLQQGMGMLMEDLHLVPLIIPHDLYGLREDVDYQPRLDRMLLGREMRRGR